MAIRLEQIAPTLEGLVLANNDNIGLTMTSNDICVSSSIVAAPFIMMTVGEIPAQPGVIFRRDGIVCRSDFIIRY
jgi:hypothetical protein